MAKDKKLEETQEIDAKAIRNASSKQTKKKKTSSKNEISKGGSRTAKTNAKKKNNSSNSKNKNAVAAKKKTSSSQKKPTQPQSNKIRRFPKEEAQEKTKKTMSAARRKKIRKIKGVLLFSLACIIVAALLAVFGISQLCKIKTITINYDLNKATQSEKVSRQYTDEQVIKAAGVAQGDNLVYVKLMKSDDIVESVGKQLPFLTVDSVDSKGMSRLILNVRQIKPFYAFTFGDTFILTDDSLNVIDHTQDKETAHKHTIVSSVSIASHEAGQKIVFSEQQEGKSTIESFLSAVKAADMKNITYINLKNIDDIYMVYDNRITVHVGNRNNIVEKLKLAAKSLASEDLNSTEQKGFLNMTIDKKAYFTQE